MALSLWIGKRKLSTRMTWTIGFDASLSPSPASIQRLKAKWQIEYEQWKNRYLSTLQIGSLSRWDICKCRS